MAYIEARKYGISGVFIDGYMPVFSELRKVDWDRALEQTFYKFPWRRDQFSKIRKHLEPGSRDYGPFVRSAIYAKLIDNVRLGFCQYTSRPKWPCDHWFHPSKGLMGIKYCFSANLNMNPDEVDAIFHADAETERAKGKGEYACNLIVIDRRPDTGCRVFKECNYHWMESLKFEPKRKKDHSNFRNVKKLAMQLLIESMIMMDSEYFEDHRLRDYFR